MQMHRLIRVLALTGLLLIVAACGGTSSPTAGTSSSTSGQKVPNSALITPGTLTVCQSVPSEPFLMYNTSGQVIGTDADTAAAIASRLGLKEAQVPSVFATMITAVQTRKCDVIISSMDVRADREAQIDQLGYLVTQAALLFQYGSGKNYGMQSPVSDPLSLCGHSIAAEIGSQGLDQITAWDKLCTAAGKPKIVETDVQDNAVQYQLLISGKVQAAIGGPEPASYYALQHPGTIVAGPTYSFVLEGIGFQKGSTVLENAILAVLNSMKADGTLLKIMQKYGDTALGIPDSFQLNAPINKTETSGEPTPPS